MRRNTWPGYALAGGVIIAALLALLLIGGGGPDGGLPTTTQPSDTRLFGAEGDVAGNDDREERTRPRQRRVRGADGVQYGVEDGRGAVLGESDQHP